MPIELKKEMLYSRLLNPLGNFEETIVPFEIRVDPLTGYTSLVHIFGREQRSWTKPDLSELIETSLARGCPFCPSSLDQMATKFPQDIIPEGRLHLGECCVFPQVMPYAVHSAVAVLSGEHFISLTDFSKEILTDGFSACQAYLKKVSDYDPQINYCYITWNYMPPAGGSIIHPHLQPHAEYSPSNYLRELMEGSKQYYKLNGTNFWADLIVKEADLEERHIGTTGNIYWMSTFAPKGLIADWTAIFQGKNSLFELSRQDIEHFSQGLMKIFRYLNDENFYSFNLCLYSGVRGDDYFWTHARIVPRFNHNLSSSDMGCTQILLDAPICLATPEDICRELKEYF